MVLPSQEITSTTVEAHYNLWPRDWAGALYVFPMYAQALSKDFEKAKRAKSHLGKLAVFRSALKYSSIIQRPDRQREHGAAALPRFGVSFLCHFNALPTHEELRSPTRPRMRRVLGLTMILTSLLYLFIGSAGYPEAIQNFS